MMLNMPHFILLLVLFLAFGLSLYICPVVIKAALKYGIVDKPDTNLKRHREPIPYLGGLVIFASLLGALAVSFPFEGPILAILLCASLIVSVGLVDDLGTLTPRDKLIGQILAALILVKAGVKIDIVGWPWPLTEALSILWMVTCINAFNILDVSDGLATVAGLVGSIGFAIIAVINNEPLTAILAASLFGACIGFLWFNKSPARIYLGDTGSMLLGTLMGSMTMIGRYSDTNIVSAFIAPFTFLALPFFDLVLVVLARTIAGRKIYYGSPDHFAVRLKDHGVSPNRIAAFSFGLGIVFISLGISSTLVSDFLAKVLGTSIFIIGAMLLAFIYWRYPDRNSPRFPQLLSKESMLSEAQPSPVSNIQP
jgi:UDP-GlcNAc:undecaprenyl-phosphate/decaprenyl-phosphate GlcNAc-1-phosphate transferase